MLVGLVGLRFLLGFFLGCFDVVWFRISRVWRMPFLSFRHREWLQLDCKNDKLRHVLSFRRQCLMFQNYPSQTVHVSFRVRHGEGHDMACASTGNIKRFEQHTDH